MSKALMLIIIPWLEANGLPWPDNTPPPTFEYANQRTIDRIHYGSVQKANARRKIGDRVEAIYMHDQHHIIFSNIVIDDKCGDLMVHELTHAAGLRHPKDDNLIYSLQNKWIENPPEGFVCNYD